MNSLCTEIIKRNSAYKHFIYRFEDRGISELIGIDELLREVRDRLCRGEYEQDSKHKGIEGPRYRVKVPVNGRMIVVVVEKTNTCYVPITLWSTSVQDL